METKCFSTSFFRRAPANDTKPERKYPKRSKQTYAKRVKEVSIDVGLTCVLVTFWIFIFVADHATRRRPK